MEQEPPRSPPTLSKFLAATDSRCEFCNYNLRGATTAFCPECGQVIPRPRVSELEKFEGRAHRLRRCRKCKYDLRGSAGGACPECGTSAYLEDDERAKARQNARLLVGVPGFLIVVGGMSLVLLVFAASKLVAAQSVGSSRLILSSIVAVALLIVPIAAVCLWAGLRGRIEELPDVKYRAAVWGVETGAVLCAIGGWALL